MYNVVTPMMKVVVALTIRADHGPVKKNTTRKSKISGLYTVSISIPTTIGTKLRFKSCRDHNHTSVAVVICCTYIHKK